MLEDRLERIGLSRAEVKIYLALIRLGSSTTGAIIKETGMRKSTVYESLNRLLEKGLVSYVIKNSVKFFEAADPERIVDFIEEQKRELEENEANIKSVMPDLKSMRNPLKPHAEAHVLVGAEGFKTMRRDVLKNAKGEHLMLGAISREPAVMPHFWKFFNRERMKHCIKMRVLHQQGTKEKPMKTELMEMRFLPKAITIPAVINIYGDRVVSLLWKEDYPICFMLINKDISDSYRKYFEILWKMSSRK
ncbi:MAG: helix-turn-helix domain-containing protein [Candidatus Aenigmarchaeota archaeon]|nr:helix-turn-helix domain-containing protein [Candidatus Aenigmarchaeota archaeon]